MPSRFSRCLPWSSRSARSGARASAERLRILWQKRHRTGLPDSVPWISRCSERVLEDGAQATVEAAVIFPVLLTLMLLTLQPICVLYTRSVMESAAGEAARLMATTETVDEDSLQAFVRRRLGAVPNLAIFHEGGPLAWDISLTRSYDSGGPVEVTVAGTVKPLPVLGAFVSALGDAGASGSIDLKVSTGYDGRPTWVEGGYDDWIALWP